MKDFFQKHVVLLGILIIAAMVRFFNFTAISLWHDEAFSALLIKYSFTEMLTRIGLDVHPPMYYIFLDGWHLLFGDTLASLRGFSVLFGILTVLGVYLLTWEIFSNYKLSLLAAFLIALNPFQIQYVSEARMYTMGACLAVFAAYSLLRALKLEESTNPKYRKNKYTWYLVFGFLAGIMNLTHYYLLFTTSALVGFAGLFLLIKYPLKRLQGLFFSLAIIIVSFLWYLPTFLFQFKQVGAGYWIDPINRYSIPHTLWTMLTGIGVDMHKTRTLWLVSIISLLVLTILIHFIYKTRNQYKWLLLLSFIAPFLGSLLFAFMAWYNNSKSSVYLVRYFLFASSFLIIMLSAWLWQLKSKPLRISLIALYAGLCLFSTYHYWNEVKATERPGMNAAAQYISQNFQTGDKIVVGTSFEFFNYKYYNSQAKTRTSAMPKLFSGGATDISQMPHFAGTAILTNEDLLPNFNLLNNGDKVWLIWTNAFGSSKPTIPDNLKEIMPETSFPDIRPYLGTNIYVNYYQFFQIN